jgi:hypothetical protein
MHLSDELIYEFITKVRGKTPDSIIHIEDVIDTPPKLEDLPKDTPPESVENLSPVVYSLFKATYTYQDSEPTIEYFIHHLSNSTSIMLPADQTPDLKEQYFSEYFSELKVEKND